MRFGRTKNEIRVDNGDFRGDLGGFEGFGPCLGISHPTHPHLGKPVFFGGELSLIGSFNLCWSFGSIQLKLYCSAASAVSPSLQRTAAQSGGSRELLSTGEQNY